MASIVHSHDKNTAFEMVLEDVYGTDPGAGYLRVPILGETLTTQREPVVQSQEFRAFGATKDPGYGIASARGTLRVQLYYNAAFLAQLFAHVFGGMEERVTGGLTTGTVGGTAAVHTHCPQSFKATATGSAGALPTGITARVHKMGPNNSAGNIERFRGLVPVAVELSHDVERGFPEASFDFVGLASDLVSGIGVDPAALAASLYDVRPKDLTIARGDPIYPSIVKVGAAPAAEIFVDGYTIRAEVPRQFPRRYATALDGAYRVGHSGHWRISGTLRGRLSQEHFGSKMPPVEMLAGTLGTELRIIYASSVFGGPGDRLIGGVVPHGFDIRCPRIRYTRVQTSNAQAGELPFTADFEGYNALAASIEHFAGYAMNAPLIVAYQCDVAQDGGGKFTPAAKGGNGLHSTLQS